MRSFVLPGVGAYQLIAGGVVRISDGARVPDDVKNPDWRKYQAWLAAANTPLAASPVVNPFVVTLTSTGDSALNGTYAVGPDQQRNITAIYAGIKGGDGLPGGGSSFGYQDASGVQHTFSATQFSDFAKAVRDYIYELVLGNNPSAGLTIP